MFALRGATVTAADISPRMVAFTEQLAEKSEVKVEGKVGAAEEFSLEDASFDVIYAANTIHHLATRPFFLIVFIAGWRLPVCSAPGIR